MIEETLFSSLTAHAGLSTLVDERIYPITLPSEPTYPTIIYQRISTPHVGDNYAGPSDLVSPRFQFSTWADTYLQAKGVTKQLRAAMRGLPSGVGSPVQGVIIMDERDMGWDVTVRKYRIDLDFQIWITEE